jgi:protoheme IX farnesyltransferase
MGAGAVAFARAPTQANARRLFRGSLVYLPLMLTAFAVHRLPNPHDDTAAALARARAQWALAREYITSALPALPAMRLRTVDERLGWIEELRLQVKCPSRVLAEDDAAVVEAEEHEEEDEGKQQQR